MICRVFDFLCSQYKASFNVNPVSFLYCKFYLIAITSVICWMSSSAANTVSYSVLDSIVPFDMPEMVYAKEGGNGNGTHLYVDFDLISSNSPFQIFKVEWGCGNIIEQPLVPFSYMARADSKSENGIKWKFHLEFPYTQFFPNDRELIVYTDKGTVRTFLDSKKILENNISDLQQAYDTQVETESVKSRNIRVVAIGVLVVLFIIGVIIFIAVRRRFILKRREIEEMSLLIAQRSQRNLELSAKVNALYGNRLDTLNMLCNEYFEKHDSEKLKISFCNEVEKHILALRDPKSVAELEDIVNTFLDNILKRIREQIPGLTQKDLIFLTYLYAGFSLRAVCIFTDIKIKNFYNRRSRLKDRILASDAKDKEYFVAKMDV